MKEILFNVIAAILSDVMVLFVWWLSGNPFPRTRGPQAVLLFVVLIYTSFIGVNLCKLIVWNWWYDKIRGH